MQLDIFNVYLLLNPIPIFLALQGCHSGTVNVEARPIDTAVYTRRCVLARLRELTVDKFKDMVSQNAAALLVLLPQDLNALEQQDREVHYIDISHTS